MTVEGGSRTLLAAPPGASIRPFGLLGTNGERAGADCGM